MKNKENNSIENLINLDSKTKEFNLSVSLCYL